MPRILIAEPSKTLAALVKLSLAELGAELEVAHDGAAALAIARARLPDALVCDQGLPGLDGYGLAHTLRQLAAEAGRAPVVVLMLVPEHATPDPERLAYVGIGDVLVKPFERAVLLERVRALLDAARPAALPAPTSGRPSSGSSAASHATALAPAPTYTPPTSPFVRPTPSNDLPPHELQGLIGAEIAHRVQAELEPLLAARLPALVDAAVQRALPGIVQAHLERAVADRVGPHVEGAVQRALAALVTPAALERGVAAEARGAVGEVAGRIEGRLENELLERLDRFARESLPARLMTHAEQIIWKIVPTIAEDIVKDEIKRLTQEPSS
ncbi:MAG: response regulator transcription factor [Deltaproteobacteria bacterium]|nr:response regulator transcription factor [Deltaproteobacteria bacterium]